MAHFGSVKETAHFVLEFLAQSQFLHPCNVLIMGDFAIASHCQEMDISHRFNGYVCSSGLLLSNDLTGLTWCPVQVLEIYVDIPGFNATSVKEMTINHLLDSSPSFFRDYDLSLHLRCIPSGVSIRILTRNDVSPLVPHHVIMHGALISGPLGQSSSSQRWWTAQRKTGCGRPSVSTALCYIAVPPIDGGRFCLESSQHPRKRYDNRSSATGYY